MHREVAGDPAVALFAEPSFLLSTEARLHIQAPTVFPATTPFRCLSCYTVYTGELCQVLC